MPPLTFSAASAIRSACASDATTFHRICAAYLWTVEGMLSKRVSALTKEARSELMLVPRMAPYIHLVGWRDEGPIAIHCHLGIERGRRTKSRTTYPGATTLPFDVVSKFDSVVSRSGPWGGTCVMTLADRIEFHGRIQRNEALVTRSDWDRVVDVRALLSESERCQ